MQEKVITVAIPESEHAWLKKFADLHGYTVKALVIKSIRCFKSQQRKPKKGAK